MKCNYGSLNEAACNLCTRGSYHYFKIELALIIIIIIMLCCHAFSQSFLNLIECNDYESLKYWTDCHKLELTNNIKSWKSISHEKKVKKEQSWRHILLNLVPKSLFNWPLAVYFQSRCLDTNQIKEPTSILYTVVCGQAMLMISYKYVKVQSGSHGFPSNQNITKSFQHLAVNIGSVSSLFFRLLKISKYPRRFRKRSFLERRNE